MGVGVQVGVQILPLDGNPYHHSAQLCHPMGASSMAVSHEGRYVFTAGGADRTAFCWEISLRSGLPLPPLPPPLPNAHTQIGMVCEV